MEITVQTIAKAYDWLERRKTKVNIIYGGAGAGKSYTLAQFIIFDILLSQKNKRVLVTRKYNPSLKLSSIKLFHEMLQGLGIPYEEHKSEQLFVFHNGNELFFRGLDDPEKIKSMEFNYIWLEEATEFDFEDYIQLRLRLRKFTSDHRNKMFLTFNPISRKHWLYKEFFTKPQDDVSILRLTYKDNPFLSEDYCKMLEALQHQDERLYKIYALGEFADLINLVYTNYEITPIEGDLSDKIVYGLDFGYNNPTALVKVATTGESIYILDEFYKSHLTNSELIEHLKQLNIGRHTIVCDSAEPDRIRELQLAGFNAIPAVKTSVQHEIDMIKRYKIIINPKCVNFIKEIETYTWKVDKNGNILDEPVKFNDHLMDAMRYAVMFTLSRYKRSKTPITSKIVMG